VAVLGLVVLAAWALFAFAGAFRWTMVPVYVGTVVLAAFERPSVGRRSRRALDLALLLCLIATAAQLVPLSPSIRQLLSPSAVAADRILRLGDPGDSTSLPWRPLSIDPESTAWALADGLSAVLLFWCARARFERHGVRRVTRGIALMGLVLSVVAILQHATAPGLIYWAWAPPNRSVRPFGPFMNRNHLATWLIMAAPLVLGYAVARIRARQRESARMHVVSTTDALQVWLGASILMMFAALAVALSRSGIMAIAIALAAFAWLASSRSRPGRLQSTTIVLATLFALALTYVNSAALVDRLGETWSTGLGERRELWADTASMASDFWLTGLGVGSFERGMLVYQRSTRLFAFSHADNEFLQIAAEGGLLVGLPIVIAALAAIARVIRLLRRDHSAGYWIRVGATCGLIAVAVQSIWENGLRLPGNAVLFALLAALALHEHHDERRGSSHGAFSRLGSRHSRTGRHDDPRGPRGSTDESFRRD
jgi:O-antigen ligase